MDTPTKTFDPMTAPLDEVREWLAGKDGWHKCDMGWARRAPCPRRRGGTYAGASTMTTTPDPMTAPIIDVLVWLANMYLSVDGWCRVGPGGAMVPVHSGDGMTLDRIAWMMKGTGWDLDLHTSETLCLARAKRFDGKTWHTIETHRPTEYEARARVVAAVLMRKGK